MTSVPYEDLLGVPYVRGSADPTVGLDCRTACFTVGARIPLEGLPGAHEAEAASYAWVGAGSSPWRYLGPEATLACKLGDLILLDTCEDAAAGVAILVDEEERLFLTANARRGRVFCARARAFRGIAGAYRWEPGA